MTTDPLTQLSEEFRSAWTSADRPGIDAYLSRADPARRTELASLLLRIDIEHRVRSGEEPSVTDYDSLGPALADDISRLIDELQSADELVDIDATQSASSHRASAATRVQSDTFRRDAPQRRRSATVGPYKLIKRIGKGGMGSVWIAEQEEPVKRRVALKLIRADATSDGTIARFDAERQAIAMMDHQNIARILDAGTTLDGLPYFVMELVDGERLDEYCDTHRFTIRERLELMILICRAVQHAHQKGILHRDLKPSNVLVATYDGRAIPKVIDFGLAKALERHNRLTDETMLTEHGEVVGTLRYMSPEQAEGLDVDTRADIYSLGVILYKLLAGSTPIQPDEVSSQSLMQTLQHLREKDPPRPSDRLLHNDEELQRISDQRSEKPDKLHQVLRGDLDWIVMKAIEKDRSRRYETANGLARDLERYLNDDEIAARPPSRLYRVRKFVRRNRGLVTSLVALSLLLIAGVIGTSAGLIWAIRERDRANDRSLAAKSEAQRARRAEKEARDAEENRRRLQTLAEIQLHSIRMKSAWSDWQMGNVESAWSLLGSAGSQGWETRFLRTEFSGSNNVLYGHALPVVAVAVSPDEQFIATASLDHTVVLRDAASHEIVARHFTPGSPTGICFSADSKQVACSDRGNHISVWQVGTPNPARVLGPFPRDLNAVAFAGGDLVVAAESDKDQYRSGLSWLERNPGPPRVLVIAIADGTIVEELNGHTKSVTDVASTSDGRSIVSCSNDRTVRIWTRGENATRRVSVLSGHAQNVAAVAIDRDATTIASCGSDKTIRIWNLETGAPIRSLIGHTEGVSSVAFSTDGQHLVSASSDGSARVWSTGGGQLAVFRGHFAALTGAAFLAENQHIITCANDKTSRVWNLTARPGTLSRKLHRELVWSASFSSDDSVIVTVSEDGGVFRLDAVTGDILGQDEDGDAVLSVACSPVADFFVTGGAVTSAQGSETTICVRRVSDGAVLKTFDAHADYIWDLAFSPDGRWLASASSDQTVRIWNTEDWSLHTTIEGHTGELASARFSQDGRFLVTSSDDKTVRVWDEKFEPVHTFTGHKNAVWRAVFSPDGDTIASSSYDGEIILWNFVTREMTRSINAHTDQIAGLAFSPDGSQLVSASDDSTMRIWDVASGIDLFVLRDRDDSQIVHVSFSRDGRRLVSGGGSGWVTIRSATATASATPFLPHQAVELCTDGLLAVTAEAPSQETFTEELGRAQKCCDHYPSYRSWTIRGIAEFRLGRYDEAMRSLREARRLEPIEYGEPDVRPFIEGFLAMAARRCGNSETAEDALTTFKRKADQWDRDQQVARLRAEVSREFDGTQNPAE